MRLLVGPRPVYYEWTFNSDPGWVTGEDWAWGEPTGGGGQHGNPDPTSGYTGNFVCGYNLDGDYPNDLGCKYLTTCAFDCSDLSDVHVSFWRWLGVDHPAHDKAMLKIGASWAEWVVFWTNPAEITDSQWVYQEFDISGFADGQPVVYLRWSMGPTNVDCMYCGWNIDDVRITGVEPAPLEADLDGDCDVDIEDLSILLANYGSTSATPEQGDLDADADVDLSDLAALLANYGRTCW